MYTVLRLLHVIVRQTQLRCLIAVYICGTLFMISTSDSVMPSSSSAVSTVKSTSISSSSCCIAGMIYSRGTANGDAGKEKSNRLTPLGGGALSAIVLGGVTCIVVVVGVVKPPSVDLLWNRLCRGAILV